MNKNWQRKMIAAWVLGVAVLGANSLFAQSSTVPASAVTRSTTALTSSVPVSATSSNAVAIVAPPESWRDGGWTLWLLALLGASGLATAFFQMLALRERRAVPRGLLDEMLARIRAGELNEARRACEDRPCPLSAMALMTFDHLRRTSRGSALLHDVVAAECRRQAMLMDVQARWLRDVAILAFLLGFLGTTMGVWQVLDAAAHETTGMAPAIVDGVASAMTSMVFGLLVAIPAMLFYSWLKRRAMSLSAALEVAAAEIMMVLADRYER
jgi:biopolymer transport protein ExbB